MGKKINTKIIHFGSDPNIHFGSLNDPIYRNSTLIFQNYESLIKAKKNKFSTPYYGRIGTYTTRRFEKLMSNLYETDFSIVTSSGLSAITITLLAFLKQNDELIITENCYEPVYNFATDELKKFGISAKFFKTNNSEKLKNLINHNTKILYIESPGSLNYEVEDLTKTVKMAKKKKVLTIMDNTWSTFVGCNPLKFGVDIVIESATKYISGHSDNFCGVIACSKEHYPKIKQTAVRLGDFVSPESCFHASKGLKTLNTRLEKHFENAKKVFNYLKNEKIISEIIFLPDKSNKYHKLWKKYHSTGNGLITFSIKKSGSIKNFLNFLRLFKIGFSWGGYESLIIPLNNLKPLKNPSKSNNYWFRIHVGLESIDDLINDLAYAIKKYENKKK